MLRVILTIVQVFSSLAIIGLVLLQRGKGAEAGAGFGAGASGTVFGARGASTALSRATAIFAAIFMINSLLLTYMGTHSVGGQTQQKSILDVAGEKSGAAGAPAANKPGPALTAAPASTAPAAPTTPVPSAQQPAPTPAPAAPASAPAQPATTAPPNGGTPNGAAPK
jgi:preprotein translocase subunit SecG